MSVLLRARLASFMTGVAVTSVYSIYQLKRDLQESHDLVAKQVRRGGARMGLCGRNRTAVLPVVADFISFSRRVPLLPPR